MHENLINFFKNIDFNSFKYIPNPGNGGDSLIALGTIDFFRENKICYKFVNRHQNYFDDGFYIYSGGGNLGKPTNISCKIISNVIKNSKNKLLVLPHTIHNVDELISKFDENIYLFAREQNSLNYILNKKNLKNCFIDHDLAFASNIQSALDYRGKVNFPFFRALIEYIYNKAFNKSCISFSCLKKYWQIEKKLRRYINNVGSKELNSFRTDGEKTSIELPTNNIDVSEVFTLGTETEFSIRYGSSTFLNFINEFDIVNTNRLHVAVGAALLGKQVNFYPNNYFKCKAVFEHTLSKYKNVNWIQYD